MPLNNFVVRMVAAVIVTFECLGVGVLMGEAEGTTGTGWSWNTYILVVIHWNIITEPNMNMYQYFSEPWK